MFYKIIDNDKLIIIHKIKEINFWEILSITFIIILDRTLWIDKINKTSKIRDVNSCCTYKDLQGILLLFEKVDLFLA